LLSRSRVRGIDQVQQQIRFGDLLQGGAECCNKLGRQLLNKPNRIGDQDIMPAGQFDPARCWIERGKKLVRDQNF